MRTLLTFSTPCPRARAAFVTLILTLDKGPHKIAVASMASDISAQALTFKGRRPPRFRIPPSSQFIPRCFALSVNLLL